MHLQRVIFFKKNFSHEINDSKLLFNLQKKLFENHEMHASYRKIFIFEIMSFLHVLSVNYKLIRMCQPQSSL